MIAAPDTIFKVREQIRSFGPKGEFLLGCIDQGDWIFPLRRVLWKDGIPSCTCELGARCPTIGKHPAGKWGNPLDPNEPRTLHLILERLKQDCTAGWGIHLGLSGIEMFDVDTKRDGLANWKNLLAELGLTHLEPFTASGSGGLHYAFERSPNVDERKGWTGPNGATSCCVKFPGLGEWCSGQHYMVLPFSIHESGNFYKLAGGPVYEQTPQALSDFINSHKRFTTPVHTPTTGCSSATAWAAPEGDYWLRRCIAYVDKIPGAVSGERGHDATYHVACEAIKEYALSFEDAMTVMLRYNERCRPSWSVEELARKLREADASLGPRGRKRTPAYQRPLSAEDQWLRDACLRIRWGRKVIVTGPGDSITRTEYATGWDPGEIDLSDFAAAPIAAVVTAPPPAPPGDGADCVSPATEQTPAVTAADDRWPEEKPRPPCEECPTPIPVLMKKKNSSTMAVMNFPCRKLSCLWCGTVKREHLKATVKHHIAELIEKRRGLDTEPVYLFRCRHEAWSRVKRFINKKCGEFMRLNYRATKHGPGEAYMVLSTVRPHGADVTPYAPESARDRFCEAIDALPCDVRGRLFASSHAWKLLPDGADEEPQWERVSRIESGKSTTEKILLKHSVPFRYARGSARWWQWSAIIFSVSGPAAEEVTQDLEAGTSLSGPAWRFTVGTRPEDPDDEWATSADPPTIASTFVLDLQ